MSSAHDREILNSIFNPLLPTGDVVFDENIPEELQDTKDDVISLEVEKAKALEVEGVKEAEKGNLDKAIELFTESILECPNRASGYNNRAQTLRLLGQTTEARIDLDNAVSLSEGKGRAACQAFCQRGLLNLKENRTEDAKADFEKAAQLGSQFAKAQLVQMNPYAALCNKMLRNVMDKLRFGESDEYKTENEKAST